jgi:hypothetical protein
MLSLRSFVPVRRRLTGNPLCLMEEPFNTIARRDLPPARNSSDGCELH